MRMVSGILGVSACGNGGGLVIIWERGDLVEFGSQVCTDGK